MWPLVVVLLALSSAMLYGVGEFVGGAASRRTSASSVLLVALPVGLVLLVLAATVTGGELAVPALSWGYASGVAGGVGLLSFYRAMAKGPMSIVSPLSSLVAAVLPVGIGLLLGERLTPFGLGGVALCLTAIALATMTGPSSDLAASRDRARWRMDSGALLAMVSGAGFGLFFVLLREAGGMAGMWPLVASRAANLTLVLVVMLTVGSTRRLVFGTVGTVVLAVTMSVCDTAANALYFFAARAGQLSVAAVITSLYPVMTVVLAQLLYRERLGPVQRFGLVLAAVGVVLVASH
jgi:drug/metabolite transporter (DMT)-like permease